MTAPDAMRHDGPFCADGALGSTHARRLGPAAGTIGGKEKSERFSFQLPDVQQREQEDDELGETVPQQFSVDVLEVDLAGTLGSDEDRRRAEQPLSQRGKSAAL